MARFQNGWVKIHRKMFDGRYDGWDIAILIWLILNANYEDGKSRANAKSGRIIVKRGQLITSISEIGNALKWDRRTIAKRLKIFEKEGIIELTMSNHGALITLCNYDKYQSQDDDDISLPSTALCTTPSTTLCTTPSTTPSSHIKELKKLRREEGKNLIQISIPTEISTETRPPPTVDGTYLEIGTRWLKIAQEEYPWRNGDKKWTVENFGRELQKIAKSLKASPDDMRRLIDRFEKDPFWRKNAASPFGLSKRSQNGLRKIDNMIASLRTEFERKQSSQTNLADLRKQFQEDFKTKEELEKILEEQDRNANRY